MIPFRGIYLAVSESKLPLQRLANPVLHPLNPYWVVHFTLRADHKVKIGPIAGTVGGWRLKPSGIRAQLVHRKTAQLEQDFLIRRGSR
jgi:hypothetical protein